MPICPCLARQRRLCASVSQRMGGSAAAVAGADEARSLLQELGPKRAIPGDRWIARVDRVPVRDRDDRHYGSVGLGRQDTGRGILEHQTVLDPLSQAPRRQREAVGCRLGESTLRSRTSVRRPRTTSRNGSSGCRMNGQFRGLCVIAPKAARNEACKRPAIGAMHFAMPPPPPARATLATAIRWVA